MRVSGNKQPIKNLCTPKSPSVATPTSSSSENSTAKSLTGEMAAVVTTPQNRSDAAAPKAPQNRSDAAAPKAPQNRDIWLQTSARFDTPKSPSESSNIRSSIFYAITFIFVLASVSIAVAFFWLIQFDKGNYTAELNAKYSYLANLKLQEISGNSSSEDFEAKKKKFRLKSVAKEQISKILADAMVLAEDSNQIGLSKIIVHKDSNYLYISANNDEWLYLDEGFTSYRYISVQVILVIVLVVLFISYAFVISKLKPLRSLRMQIKKFAAGDYSSIENIASGSDEISQIADAFYQAVCKIKDMNQSRQFFLRNIMHELKTPITKGRITAEMLEDGKFKDRLINVFERMVVLIDELAAVEQTTSGVGKNIKKVSINNVFDEAIAQLLLESNESVSINCVHNFSVMVDYKLFSTAIKNMIDNALKYSDDGRMSVNILPARIDFKNRGKELDKELSFYLEPFTQGGNRSSNSFGLGLYVVSTILDAHGLKLEYFRDGDYNVFSFVNISKIKVTNASKNPNK